MDCGGMEWGRGIERLGAPSGGNGQKGGQDLWGTMGRGQNQAGTTTTSRKMDNMPGPFYSENGEWVCVMGGPCWFTVRNNKKGLKQLKRHQFTHHCRACRGTGEFTKRNGDEVDCRKCDGTGVYGG